MSFVVAAALGVGLLIGLPIAAHLLRRGKARERAFPPTALVPAARSVARERATLEDRALLAIRGLLILCLAVIGATPFVRCSRLSLTRSAGASVAFALLLDDSHSMRARGADGPRWERATRAAR
ncbi:MAG TPA: BatA domain-containing protein, partial [Polyangiaceae bacterium]